MEEVEEEKGGGGEGRAAVPGEVGEVGACLALSLARFQM